MRPDAELCHRADGAVVPRAAAGLVRGEHREGPVAVGHRLELERAGGPAVLGQHGRVAADLVEPHPRADREVARGVHGVRAAERRRAGALEPGGQVGRVGDVALPGDPVHLGARGEVPGAAGAVHAGAVEPPPPVGPGVAGDDRADLVGGQGAAVHAHLVQVAVQELRVGARHFGAAQGERTVGVPRRLRGGRADDRVLAVDVQRRLPGGRVEHARQVGGRAGHRRPGGAARDRVPAAAVLPHHAERPAPLVLLEHEPAVVRAVLRQHGVRTVEVGEHHGGRHGEALVRADRGTLGGRVAADAVQPQHAVDHHVAVDLPRRELRSPGRRRGRAGRHGVGGDRPGRLLEAPVRDLHAVATHLGAHLVLGQGAVVHGPRPARRPTPCPARRRPATGRCAARRWRSSSPTAARCPPGRRRRRA